MQFLGDSRDVGIKDRNACSQGGPVITVGAVVGGGHGWSISSSTT